jgi:tetratricopeptide (TPR) repeat protein
MSRHLTRSILSATVAIALVGAALPALAQGTAHLRGKVVDETGKPVPQAEVVLEFVGDLKQSYKVMTDRMGEWVKTGMIATPGTWNITVTSGKKTGYLSGVRNKIGEMTRVAEIVISEGAANAATKAPAGMSSDEIAKRNKRQLELEALSTAINTAFDAGNYDEAMAKLEQMAKEPEMAANARALSAVHAKMGDVHAKKNDLKAAEAAYLKAIEVDATQPSPYAALATIYNEQKKFDEATKMGAKAAELMGASGSTDPTAMYNQGVIYWNQGKAAEAKAEWEKAIKIDPKMSDAYYWLGMANVNLGKIPEAKTAFNEYLKLAPTGQHAATVKAILDTIK